MKIYRILILTSLLLLCLTGCDKKVFYAEEKSLDERGWNKDESAAFEVEVDDSTQVYNFFIDLRNSVNYTKANAFLFINTTFPDGSVAYDTLECPLAGNDGRWYGKVTGRYVDNRYYFRKHVIFPNRGTYRFEILHGMRDTNVVGLKSVGLRIEKVTY